MLFDLFTSIKKLSKKEITWFDNFFEKCQRLKKYCPSGKVLAPMTILLAFCFSGADLDLAYNHREMARTSTIEYSIEDSLTLGEYTLMVMPLGIAFFSLVIGSLYVLTRDPDMVGPIVTGILLWYYIGGWFFGGRFQ